MSEQKAQSRFKMFLWPLVILVAAIGVFVLLTQSKPEQLPVEVERKVWPVKVIEVRSQTLSPMVSLYGTVESRDRVTVSAPVTGVVATLAVREGQAFNQGDLLVALADSDIDLPYQIALADVAEAEAEMRIQELLFEANQARLKKEKHVLVLKQNDLRRNEQLIKKDLASKTTVEQSKEALVRQEYTVVGAELSVAENKAKVAQLKARLAKARANLAQAKVDRERGRVQAPYAGRVATVSVAEGDRVATNSPLLTYYGLGSLELRAKIPGFALPSVDKALQDGVPLTASLSLGDNEYVLPLLRLAGEASASGLDGLFQIPDAIQIARPGDLWQVRLQGQPLSDVMAVPYSAIYGSDRVYIVEDGAMKSVRVQKLGDVVMRDEADPAGETWAIIRADLPQGAQVITTHLPNAINGLSVAVVP